LIADAGWPVARTLAEGFTRLQERGVLGPNTADSMRRAVGLRNVVAYGYSGIDVAVCFRAATVGLADIERFASEVSAWAERDR
jgi:uncharacterized protein YutE (UPF0331/DUF86 family)